MGPRPPHRFLPFANIKCIAAPVCLIVDIRAGILDFAVKNRGCLIDNAIELEGSISIFPIAIAGRAVQTARVLTPRLVSC